MNSVFDVADRSSTVLIIDPPIPELTFMAPTYEVVEGNTAIIGIRASTDPRRSLGVRINSNRNWQ